MRYLSGNDRLAEGEYLENNSAEHIIIQGKGIKFKKATMNFSTNNIKYLGIEAIALLNFHRG